MEYYRSMGLKKELFDPEDYYERWSLFTPLEMDEEAGRGKRYLLVFSHHGGGSSIETDEFSTGYMQIAGREKFMVAFLQNSNWERTEIHYGYKHYTVDIRNRDGINAFRYVSVENCPHWPCLMMGELAWNFSKQFRRGSGTGKIVKDLYQG